MIKFLINAGFVLVFLFIFALIGSAMLWIIMKVLRSLFPKRFATDKKRESDEV